jgi:hypothetical protein
VLAGIDPDARLVNLKVVVPTNIIRLRSLPAPAYLPLRSRLRPVETTVWAVDASGSGCDCCRTSHRTHARTGTKGVPRASASARRRH